MKTTQLIGDTWNITKTTARRGDKVFAFLASTTRPGVTLKIWIEL